MCSWLNDSVTPINISYLNLICFCRLQIFEEEPRSDPMYSKVCQKTQKWRKRFD